MTDLQPGPLIGHFSNTDYDNIIHIGLFYDFTIFKTTRHHNYKFYILTPGGLPKSKYAPAMMLQNSWWRGLDYTK